MAQRVTFYIDGFNVYYQDFFWSDLLFCCYLLVNLLIIWLLRMITTNENMTTNCFFEEKPSFFCLD